MPELEDLYQQALAAVPDGACRMLVAYSRARFTGPDPVADLLDDERLIVDRHHDGSVTLVWDQFNTRILAAVIELTMQELHQGPRYLSAPPEQFFAHPDGWCPACAESSMPGPEVWGIWLAQDWERAHVRAALRAGEQYDVHRFANRTVAEAAARGNFAALLRARRRWASRTLVEITVLDRDPRTAPRYRLDFVAEHSQLRLWHENPAEPAVARRNRQWPDEVLLFDPGADRIATVPGPDFAEQADAADAAAETRRARQRAANPVGFQVTTLDGCQITWYREAADDREGGLCSILDPGSAEPAQRLLDDGAAESIDGAPRGLTVYGRHRHDRPSFARAAAMTPQYAYLLTGITEGRGSTAGG
ncbi:hypothetical protein [Amycolatopsis sp. NPDC004079]|uniref:hypothetical protein n=1 Tax=Amycolatopsis sp. NPDC004079 TaxID=3154549 RepID=UPI0033A2B1D2